MTLLAWPILAAGLIALIWGVFSVIHRAVRRKRLAREAFARHVPPEVVRGTSSPSAGSQYETPSPASPPASMPRAAGGLALVREIIAIVGGIVSILVGILTIAEKW